MRTLVFATHNPHKRTEVAQLLHGFFEVKNLDDLGLHDEIPEDATTLEGNARIKAEFVFNRTGLNVFADDTGLEVDALGGAPGVYSARYAGPACDATQNMTKLLSELAGNPNRKARFRTVIHLILNGEHLSFTGEAEGRIIEAPRGEGGFGYDPVFVPELPDDMLALLVHQPSFAELSSEQKNRISHRGKAMRKLIAFLKEQAQS